MHGMHVARAARPWKVTCFKGNTVCLGGAARLFANGIPARPRPSPGQTSPISWPDFAHLLAGPRPYPSRTSPISQPDHCPLPARPLTASPPRMAGESNCVQRRTQAVAQSAALGRSRLSTHVFHEVALRAHFYDALLVDGAQGGGQEGWYGELMPWRSSCTKVLQLMLLARI